MRKARRLSTDELRARAKKAKKQPSVRTAQVAVFLRDAAVAEVAKRLANGLCDLCEQPAPFQNKSNEAYLECHHIIWLAQGGEDTIANTVALCPLPRASKNCTVNQRASEFRHGGIF